MSVGKESIKRAAGAGTKKTTKRTTKKTAPVEEQVVETAAPAEVTAVETAPAEEKKAKAGFVQIKDELPVYLL